IRAISGANVRVCTEPASGTPCTPLATIYSNPDLAVGHQLPNPFQADTSGNFQFCVSSPSDVHVQISSPSTGTQDIPYVTLSYGSGGGGGTPCGFLYDIQINDPQGIFGCDTGVFYYEPPTHTMYLNNPGIAGQVGLGAGSLPPLLTPVAVAGTATPGSTSMFTLRGFSATAGQGLAVESCSGTDCIIGYGNPFGEVSCENVSPLMNC